MLSLLLTSPPALPERGAAGAEPVTAGGLAAGVAAERAGGSELAQLVADHVLGDIHGNMTAAVVDGDGVTDEGRENGGGLGSRS
jgi:hypothetical protein